MCFMRVNRMTEDDWERLREIRLKALAHDPDAFGSSLQRETGFKESHWRMRLRASPSFLATLDDEVVGLVGLIQEPAAPVGERHLVALWVAPERRRRGVGQALIAAAEEWARSDKATALSVWHVEDNEPARALYEHCGFAATDVRVPLPRDPKRTEERWLKPL
jgi:GNAT superfamily N-acetyltransferase